MRRGRSGSVARVDPAATLTIRDLAAATGVNEATLRMWESRHAFPVPQRLASGHRRYTQDDLEAVRGIVRGRSEGLSLASAIERARLLSAEPLPSVFSALRERFPELAPSVLPKRALIRLSQALEDECALRARRPVLFGGFQQERFYRASQPRWRELARTADLAIVFADFARSRRPRGGPVELALGADDELMREWVVVCDAPNAAACLAAWERPRGRSPRRLFEAVWTVEREVVRHAARICVELAARTEPELVAPVRERLSAAPPATDDEVRQAMALANRMVAYAVDETR
jgi:MerR family transcriptional regulator, light-induced transcriptional regulator